MPIDYDADIFYDSDYFYDETGSVGVGAVGTPYPGIKTIRMRGPARVIESLGPRREVVLNGPTRTMRFPQ